MTEAIVIALITGTFSILGIIVTAILTKSTMMNEMEKQLELMKLELKEMKQDIKEHNGYAKMFAETMPVIKERISVANHRIDDLERKVEHENKD